MSSLKSLVDKSELVLIDASIRANGTNVFDYCDYDNPKYQQVFQSEIKGLERLLDVFNSPIAITIPEVAEEISKYYQLVSRSYDRFKQKRETPIEFLEYLEKMRNLAEDVTESAERCSTDITHPAYQHFQEMVTLLSQELDLKSDTDYIRGQRDENHSYDSDTDEKLAATVLWESGMKERQPTLLTNDRDFENLLSVVPWILGSDHFRPYNEIFRTNFRKNKFSVHRVQKGGTQKLTYPDYTFTFQRTPNFWLPQKLEETRPPNYPVGPKIRELIPRSIKKTIPIQQKLHQHWEAIARDFFGYNQ